MHKRGRQTYQSPVPTKLITTKFVTKKRNGQKLEYDSQRVSWVFCKTPMLMLINKPLTRSQQIVRKEPHKSNKMKRENHSSCKITKFWKSNFIVIFTTWNMKSNKFQKKKKKTSKLKQQWPKNVVCWNTESKSNLTIKIAVWVWVNRKEKRVPYQQCLRSSQQRFCPSQP